MNKPLEQTLADYLLALARGSWTREYNRRCLAMWTQLHGEAIASRVEKLVREKWPAK